MCAVRRCQYFFRIEARFPGAVSSSASLPMPAYRVSSLVPRCRLKPRKLPLTQGFLLMLGLALSAAAASSAFAQAQRLPDTQPVGFRLERYEPTSAGSSLLLVERPWYSPQRQFAVALTLGYAHRPLRFFVGERALPAVVDHALGGSLDLAGSPLPWLQLRGSLPLTLLESGTTDPTAAVAPMDSATIGDPRLGASVALFRRPDSAAFSVHLGLDVWLPVGLAYTQHQGDIFVRGLPRVILAGVLPRGLRWTFEAGFLGRGDSQLGNGSRMIVAGSEVQLGAALSYTTPSECLQLALEGRFAARVTQTSAPTGDALRGQLLVSAQLQAGPWFQLGAAVGSDFQTPGSPDARALLRLEMALPQRRAMDSALTPSAAPIAGSLPRATEVSPPPVKSGPASEDADGDGIPDEQDRCPYEPEDRNGVRDDDGCPESPLSIKSARFTQALPPTPPPAIAVPARMADPGTLGAQAPGPATAAEPAPVSSPPRAGPTAAAAPADSDQDGIVDEEDRCPLSAEDRDGFEDDDGCPELDNDDDGIPDAQDRCPLEAETINGVDDEDGCPDVAALPAPQAVVSAARDRIEVNQQVQFELRKVTIAATSLPLLREIARILRTHPAVRIEVQGHTDGIGDPAANLALSQQRAEAVREFLIAQGIAAERLRARGYGATQPRASNDTPLGRAKNRRVEFVIVGDGK
jgi:outer membrane protein OmpA-like peptidoglycan-associated protein